MAGVSRKPSLQELPSELLLEIFEWFALQDGPIMEELLNLQLVCKRFRSLLSNPHHMWRHLVISYGQSAKLHQEACLASLASWLRTRASAITQVSLYGCSHSQATIVGILAPELAEFRPKKRCILHRSPPLRSRQLWMPSACAAI